MEHFGTGNLNGKSFLDVGCGTGLFSVAAVRLGEARVHSFDCDPQSMACAEELQGLCLQNGGYWTFEQSHVLDATYLSWFGHLTWCTPRASCITPETATCLPWWRPPVFSFIAVFNDQRLYSRLWRI